MNRWPALLLPLVMGAACTSRPADDASRAALRLPVAIPTDPTLRPARLVPLRTSDPVEKSYGTEPGGGKRVLVSGVRVVQLAGGGVQSALDPLPSEPIAIAPVPERMGGGFLFVIGEYVYRADGWLTPLTLIHQVRATPTRLLMGLDRAYVRLANGAYMAFDAKTGAAMDLGPWPASPEVSRFVAADGWRAVAIADMRGAVATFDAGGSWQPLGLAIQPKDLHLAGDAIVVTGMDASGVEQSFAVEPNGQIAHLETAPVHAKPKADGKADTSSSEQRVTKSLLATTVLDGWPLVGGAALVARDGALTRVRISDGAVLDTAPDAFPLKPAHCHPITMSPVGTPGAVGFVCGTPHGATEIYRYDAAAGNLVTLRHFDGPRAVFSPSNGPLVIEGACDADAVSSDLKKPEQTYCLMRKNGLFEDFIVNGDVGTERVVPLADGRTAILSPPVGDLATARLTIFDGKRPKTIAVAFANGPTAQVASHNGSSDDDEEADAPDADAIVNALLRSGTWLRGVEERKPGVLSAWVEHSGRYVGVEVTLDGKAKHGPYVADLGNAVVSGRYGLGWTPSRQGYETTDGGMTWAPLVLPEPLESPGPMNGPTKDSMSGTHGCGPLGCVLSGWIRVGWGARDEASPSSYPSSPDRRTFDVRSPTSVSLRCDLAGKTATATLDPSTPQSSYGGYYGYYGRYSRYGRQVTTQDWHPFYTVAAPTLGTDDLGFSARTDEMFDHASDRNNNGSQLGLGSALARFYAWGPKGTDWQNLGRFLVRFASPFESSSVIHSTQAIPTPQYIGDSWNYMAVGGAAHPLQGFALVAGEDGAHALLVLRRNGPYVIVNGSYVMQNDTVVVEIEEGRPAMEVHRADGTSLGELESATQAAGKWYLATTEGHDTVIHEVDSGVAREITRIPRTTEGNERPPAVHLGRRADGRMIAALVDGAPLTQGAARPSRWEAETWALPIDVETGLAGEPERLGASDGGNKTIRACRPQDGGWVVDGRWPAGTIDLRGASGSSLRHTGTLFVRYHVTADTLCVEKLSSSSYGDLTGIGSLGKTEGPFVSLGLYLEQARQGFRCVENK